MPIYTFLCEACGPFEKRASFDDARLLCQCGGNAQRAPFSGAPIFHVEGRYTPTAPAEKQQYELKKARESGWDYDRSMSLIRKNTHRDKEGHLHVNTQGVMSGGKA